MTSEQSFTKTVAIAASPATVWHALTDIDTMKQWMAADEEIGIITTWEPGGAFTIRGNKHGLDFENFGTVLVFEPYSKLSYSHRSSISRLSDELQNYTVLQFDLHHEGDGTMLTFSATGFPTESIHRHVVYYWNVALEVLKKKTEELTSSK